MLVPVVRRASVASRSSVVSLLFSTNLSRLFSIDDARAVERRRGHVDELYFKSFLREDLGDAVAHRSCANHSHPFDVEHVR